MNDLYIVALVTGLVGSLHFIGMCGPIAIALPPPHVAQTCLLPSCVCHFLVLWTIPSLFLCCLVLPSPISMAPPPPPCSAQTHLLSSFIYPFLISNGQSPQSSHI